VGLIFGRPAQSAIWRSSSASKQPLSFASSKLKVRILEYQYSSIKQVSCESNADFTVPASSEGKLENAFAVLGEVGDFDDDDPMTEVDETEEDEEAERQRDQELATILKQTGATVIDLDETQPLAPAEHAPANLQARPADVIAEQDRAYNASLQRDREKARVAAEKEQKLREELERIANEEERVRREQAEREAALRQLNEETPEARRTRIAAALGNIIQRPIPGNDGHVDAQDPEDQDDPDDTEESDDEDDILRAQREVDGANIADILGVFPIDFDNDWPIEDKEKQALRESMSMLTEADHATLAQLQHCNNVWTIGEGRRRRITEALALVEAAFTKRRMKEILDEYRDTCVKLREIQDQQNLTVR
jgi:hypothetical protein